MPSNKKRKGKKTSKSAQAKRTKLNPKQEPREPKQEPSAQHPPHAPHGKEKSSRSKKRSEGKSKDKAKRQSKRPAKPVAEPEPSLRPQPRPRSRKKPAAVNAKREKIDGNRPSAPAKRSAPKRHGSQHAAQARSSSQKMAKKVESLSKVMEMVYQRASTEVDRGLLAAQKTLRADSSKKKAAKGKLTVEEAQMREQVQTLEYSLAKTQKHPQTGRQLHAEADRLRRELDKKNATSCRLQKSYDSLMQDKDRLHQELAEVKQHHADQVISMEESSKEEIRRLEAEAQRAEAGYRKQIEELKKKLQDQDEIISQRNHALNERHALEVGRLENEKTNLQEALDRMQALARRTRARQSMASFCSSPVEHRLPNTSPKKKEPRLSMANSAMMSPQYIADLNESVPASVLRLQSEEHSPLDKKEVAELRTRLNEAQESLLVWDQRKKQWENERSRLNVEYRTLLKDHEELLGVENLYKVLTGMGISLVDCGRHRCSFRYERCNVLFEFDVTESVNKEGAGMLHCVLEDVMTPVENPVMPEFFSDMECTFPSKMGAMFLKSFLVHVTHTGPMSNWTEKQTRIEIGPDSDEEDSERSDGSREEGAAPEGAEDRLPAAAPPEQTPTE